MLKDRILAQGSSENNCAQAILRAVAVEYAIPLSEELLEACRGLHGGFGINGMCSGIVAGIMALGLLCEEEALKQKRILFLLAVQEKFGGLDCCTLSSAATDCNAVLAELAAILETVIEM